MIKKSFTAPYEGPYKVIRRDVKSERSITVLSIRLTTTFLVNNEGTNISRAQEYASTSK